MTARVAFSPHGLRIAIALFLALLAGKHARAQQYPPGSMGGAGGSTAGGPYTAPSGGYGSAGKAAGIGAGAAAGGGVLFLALRHHPVTGCVEVGEDGLRFVDEKKNTSYALIKGDVYLKAGERVELVGQKSKSDSGAQTFTAKKLVKNLGACGETNPAGEAKAAAVALGSSY